MKYEKKINIWADDVEEVIERLGARQSANASVVVVALESVIASALEVETLQVETPGLAFAEQEPRDLKNGGNMFHFKWQKYGPRGNRTCRPSAWERCTFL